MALRRISSWVGDSSTFRGRQSPRFIFLASSITAMAQPLSIVLKCPCEQRTSFSLFLLALLKTANFDNLDEGNYEELLLVPARVWEVLGHGSDSLKTYNASNTLYRCFYLWSFHCWFNYSSNGGGLTVIFRLLLTTMLVLNILPSMLPKVNQGHLYWNKHSIQLCQMLIVRLIRGEFYRVCFSLIRSNYA